MEVNIQKTPDGYTNEKNTAQDVSGADAQNRYEFILV